MYQYVEKSGMLRVGEERLVDRIDAPGWLLAAAARVWGSLDGKYVRVRVEIDGPDRAYPIEFSPHKLKLAGDTLPVNYGGFLTVYDDSCKAYAGAVAPSMPIPFAKRIEIKLIAPSTPVEEPTAPPINYYVAYALAKVIDEREFRQSLRSLLGLGA